jgi:hypothetical protein
MNHNTYKKKKMTDVILSLEVDNEEKEQIKTVEFQAENDISHLFLFIGIVVHISAILCFEVD